MSSATTNFCQNILTIMNKFLESSIIVGTGMLMHLNRISVIELQKSKVPMLVPNAASSIFVFSVLCILNKLRPLWPNALRKPQKCLIFIMEITLILYATDFILRQVWLPILKLLNFICHFMSQYVIVANEDYLTNSAPYFSSWIRNDAFYLIRFLIAIVALIFMTDITGMTEVLCAKFKIKDGRIGFMLDNSTKSSDSFDENNYKVMRNNRKNSVQHSDGFSGMKSNQNEFNLNDLPAVPQEDLLNIGHRVGARRRQNSLRKLKKQSRSNDAPNEYSC